MYESYWQFTQKPFEHGADPRFYFPAEAHRAVMLQIRYAIETHAAAALLLGPGGTGKTLLVHLLRRELPEQFRPFVHVVFPQMPGDDLLAYLADELGAPPAEGRNVRDSVKRIQGFLAENSRQGRHAVLVIDEAHLIDDPRTLEALRLLLNFEFDARPCLTLLLVGQPPLLSLVEGTPSVEERLTVKCVLRPLTPEETAGYVNHRLAAAGVPHPVFDAASLALLHDQTRGIPRKINRLCDLALLIGFAEEQPAIGPAQVDAVSRELAVATAE